MDAIWWVVIAAVVVGGGYWWYRNHKAKAAELVADAEEKAKNIKL